MDAGLCGRAMLAGISITFSVAPSVLATSVFPFGENAKGQPPSREPISFRFAVSQSLTVCRPAL